MDYLKTVTLFTSSSVSDAAFSRAAQFYTEPVELVRGFWIKFQADQHRGSGVLISTERVLEDSVVEITPSALEASAWFTLEAEIKVTSLHKVAVLLPVIEAFANKATSVLAVLRVVYADGRSEDFSSQELEFNGDTVTQAFPIVVPEKNFDSVIASRIIFFIEGRSSKLSLGSIRLIAVPRNANIQGIKRNADLHAQISHKRCSIGEKMRLSVETVALPAEGVRHLKPYEPVVQGIWFGFKRNEDDELSLQATGSHLLVDFSGCTDHSFRTLEFEFERTQVTALRGVILSFEINPLPANSDLRCRAVFRAFVGETFEDQDLGDIVIRNAYGVQRTVRWISAISGNPDIIRVLLFLEPDPVGILVKEISLEAVVTSASELQPLGL